MDLTKSILVAASGMKAQGERLKIVSENLANANSTAPTQNDEPYRRRMVTFRNELDADDGVMRVQVDRVVKDESEFERRFDPSHPSANDQGYVLLPNVNSLIEVMDMREAQRSYEANVTVIESAKSMIMRTVELLRA